jgi:LPPG:FO 2-phospho-L-lactate transferase
MFTVLAGGIGAAKFFDGLAGVVPPEEITVIANTGDDACFHGLHVSPDVDTVIYTLAGLVDRERGWGVAGDTFHCLEALRRLGEEAWFQLGDCDLALHLRRTNRLREGATLSEITQEVCAALHIACRIIPMTNSPAQTRVRTPEGVLPFQEYFVKLGQRPEVLEVDLSAASAASAAPGVLEAIENAEAVILAPSNPFISIGPILAVGSGIGIRGSEIGSGIRQALRYTHATVAAISPIVGGKALKGPADRMLQSLGFESSAACVAELYRDFLDIFVLDVQDASLKQEIERKGMRVLVTETVMSSTDARRELARVLMAAIRRKN